MNMKILFVAGGALLLAGCVTARVATAEERAYCEKMAENMGTATTHDHNEMKGLPANQMNLTHAQCQKILAKPAQ